MSLNAQQWFNAFVDSHLERWTVSARHAMLKNGEDAMTELLGEIVEDLNNPISSDREKMKLYLAALGFVQAYKSAFCSDESGVDITE